MAKRNATTTNASRQMQRATPHRRWKSNAAHVAYQRAVKWYGADSAEAAHMLQIGVRPPSVLQMLRDAAQAEDRRSRAEKLIARMTQRRPRQPSRLPLLAGLTGLLALAAFGLGVQL